MNHYGFHYGFIPTARRYEINTLTRHAISLNKALQLLWVCVFVFLLVHSLLLLSWKNMIMSFFNEATLTNWQTDLKIVRVVTYGLVLAPSFYAAQELYGVVEGEANTRINRYRTAFDITILASGITITAAYFVNEWQITLFHVFPGISHVLVDLFMLADSGSPYHQS